MYYNRFLGLVVAFLLIVAGSLNLLNSHLEDNNRTTAARVEWTNLDKETTEEVGAALPSPSASFLPQKPPSTSYILQLEKFKLELPLFPPCIMLSDPSRSEAEKRRASSWRTANSVNCDIEFISRPAITQMCTKTCTPFFFPSQERPFRTINVNPVTFASSPQLSPVLRAPSREEVAGNFSLFKRDWVGVPNFLQHQLKSLVLPEKDPMNTNEPFPIRHFRFGLILPEFSCIPNLWHGLLENTVALFDLLVRTGLLDAARKGEVALLVAMPKRNAWAPMNIGCGSRNTWPYGLSFAHWVGRMFLTMLGVPDLKNPDADAELYKAVDKSPGEPYVGRVFFYGERRSSKFRTNPFHGVVNVTELASVGLPRTCVPFYYNFELGKGPYWPYINDTSQHPYGEYCRKLLKAFRELVLREHGFSPTVFNAPVADRERECPKVVLIRSPTGASGRVILNFPDVRSAIVKVLDEKCPQKTYKLQELFLENYTVIQQMELMLDTTILIAARGAGMVNSLFLRPGTGTFSLSIADRTLPINSKTDHYPFYPFISVLDRHHVVISNCDADVGPAANNNCLQISRNYCEMTCRPHYVERALHKLFANMQSGKESLVVPPVVVKKGSEYFSDQEQ